MQESLGKQSDKVRFGSHREPLAHEPVEVLDEHRQIHQLMLAVFNDRPPVDDKPIDAGRSALRQFENRCSKPLAALPVQLCDMRGASKQVGFEIRPVFAILCGQTGLTGVVDDGFEPVKLISGEIYALINDSARHALAMSGAHDSSLAVLKPEALIMNDLRRQCEKSLQAAFE